MASDSPLSVSADDLISPNADLRTDDHWDNLGQFWDTARSESPCCLKPLAAILHVSRGEVDSARSKNRTGKRGFPRFPLKQ